MENHKYRFNWNSPIVLSPQDGQTVYFGGDVLFKTTNHGQSWDVISPDLTTNDKSKQKSSGGPIVTDNTAAEFHCTIIAIAPSPVDPNVIWVGTDDGNVQVTRDGGKTWTNVVKNIQGLAPNAWIPTIEASHFDAGTAYVAADHHQDNDYTAYFYKTTDYGQTWTKLNVGDPTDDRLVARDPRRPEEPDAPLRRHRARPLGVVRRRRDAGRRSATTCRRRRCATSRSSRATTTCSSRRTAAASTSWTTSRRCSTIAEAMKTDA